MTIYLLNIVTYVYALACYSSLYTQLRIYHLYIHRFVVLEARAQWEFYQKQEVRIMTEGYKVIHLHCVMDLASQSTSSETSGHSKKISTTSFGSNTTGGDYLSTTLERTLKDKSEIFGMFVLTFIYFETEINLSLICRRQCVHWKQ